MKIYIARVKIVR